jgi:hypothetical protein
MDLPYIQITRGTNFLIPLNFDQPDGTALDLTGCKVYFTVKPSPDDSTDDSAAIFQQTLMPTGANAINGLATVVGVPNDTKTKRIGDYLYDVELLDSGGSRISFGIGKFTITADITRRA